MKYWTSFVKLTISLIKRSPLIISVDITNIANMLVALLNCHIINALGYITSYYL